MAITPNTELYLIKSPLELDNKNQLTFATKQAQANYFLSLPKLETYQFTYQRKDGVIRYPAHIDSIIEYNYVMYKNNNYTDKWFYAYIDKMEYINDNMTNIYISTDVYQTWMFDIDVKRSFVIREHVNDDTFGLNTVPESLETGEYIQNGDMTPFTYLRNSVDWTHGYYPSEFITCVGSNRDLTVSSFDPLYGGLSPGFFSGVGYYVFPMEADFSHCLKKLSDAGHIDAIESVFLIPKSWLYTNPTWIEPFGTGVYKVGYPDIDNILNCGGKNIDIQMKNSIDGYTPVNKKLLTSEYNYLYVTNYTGADTTYKYEHFVGTTGGVKSCNFQLRGSIGPGCSIELVPSQYYKSNDLYQAASYSLPAPKLPLCNWNSDQYTNWLAQTGVNRALSIAGSVVSGVAGAAMIATGAGAGIGAGLIVGGIGGIISQAAQVHEHSYAPNSTSGSLNSSDINFINSRCFGFYPMSIKAEFARKIDRIFSAIGYRVNEMKIPNITGRTNWNYVQTQACAILGDVPQEDLQTIKDMFDSGVTFWHNPSTFLDYSQNNAII